MATTLSPNKPTALTFKPAIKEPVQISGTTTGNISGTTGIVQKKPILIDGGGSSSIIKKPLFITKDESDSIKMDLMKEGIIAMPYADAISTMYYYTAAREVKRGESLALANKYIALHPKDFALKATDKLLKQAVAEFNAIETNDDLELPKAGLVGEIYVKYNKFANGDVCDWLMAKGVEVIVPPVFDFFVQKVISEQVNKETNARDVSFLGYYGSKLSEKVIDVRVDSINQIIAKICLGKHLEEDYSPDSCYLCNLNHRQISENV